MRDIIQVIATAFVIAVAVVCTLVQLGDVDHAIGQLGGDERAGFRQVSGSSTGGK